MDMLLKRSKLEKVFVATFLAILLLLGLTADFWPGTKLANANSGSYMPIKFAEIVLGGYDYHARHSWNPIQRVENWIYGRGVPYDVFQDDDIEAPTDNPSLGKFPLQYANGSSRYQTLILVPNSHNDASAVNTNLIYSAVSSGTNAIILGTAAKLVPDLLGISSSEVTYVEDYSPPYGVNCTLLKTVDDGISEYIHGSTILVGKSSYFGHTKLENSESKTVWYNWSRKDHWGIGMMNGTYGEGEVWYNSLVADRHDFLKGASYSLEWVENNWAFIGHAINFMFNNCQSIELGIQGYKQWKGGVVLRLDQDTTTGIDKPINEEALKAGWVYDYSICALGYMRYLGSAYGGAITIIDGVPVDYVGLPSSKVKHGNATGIVFGTVTNGTTETFIIYNSTVDGEYDRMKMDFNKNQDFSDDLEYRIWENITYPNMIGEYFWGYVDDPQKPTKVDFGWWCSLREAMPADWLTTYKYYGEQYDLNYGFHDYQHATFGNSTFYSHTYSWNGSEFVANQTYAEEMFNRARDELAYVFGNTGYGYEADKVLISHGGNEYNTMTRNALGNLSFILYEYGASGEHEPGFYLPEIGHPILSAGFGEEPFSSGKVMDAYVDMFNTLYSVMAMYSHNTGSYNLSYVFTPYSDMFKPANGRDLYHFWSNARYMLRNTLNAYYKNGKIVLEYKANETLVDFVWRFPLEIEGKYFSTLSDNRMTGKIKHIDGRYVYVEFGRGQGFQKIEASYRKEPHILRISRNVENLTQSYTGKNLTLQLWNTSGSVDVEVNCLALGSPDSSTINGLPLNFEYNSTTRLCSFNASLQGLTTMKLFWLHAPPNPPALLSPNERERFDRNEPVTFAWAFSDYDLDDTQSAYQFQLDEDSNFISPLIDTGQVTSPSPWTKQTLPDALGLYYWRAKTWDTQHTEGDWSHSRQIIIDRLNIFCKGVSSNRTDVSSLTYIYFGISREFDDALFDERAGEVYVNGSKASWDGEIKCWKFGAIQNSVGNWDYQVSHLIDMEYGITEVNDAAGSQEVIWDQLMVTIVPGKAVIVVGEQVDFSIKAVHAYDNKKAVISTVNISRNGTSFATGDFSDYSSTEAVYLYTIDSITDAVYGLTTFTSNSPTTEWVPKSFAQLLSDWMATNALVLILVTQGLILLIYLIIRERRRHRLVQTQ